jgi:hypothetical protein
MTSANKPTSTFLAQAFLDAETIGGRFARVRTGPLIVGATPLPQYPAASHHQGADDGPAEPLGIDVSYVAPVGEPIEVAASMKAENE